MRPTVDAVAKLERLRASLGRLPSALVCFSGGVDSSFLLSVAVEVLGDRARALTGMSPSMPAEEVEAAREFAEGLGVTPEIVETRELDDPRYVANAGDRCRWCKSQLYRVARERCRGAVILDGTNLDDLSDHRPGLQAAREAGILSPLADAQLTKAEIRALSRLRGLATADKPSAPCLASRIPPGMEVTEDRLSRIARAERAVRGFGFRSFRIRFHESVARLEVDEAEIGRLMDPSLRAALARAVKSAGFAFVALDLEPFRSGRLNVLLKT